MIDSILSDSEQPVNNGQFCMNAFNIPERSCLIDEVGIKPSYPQLTYYHRAMANGTHPRKLRSLGLPVVDRRFKANRCVGATPQQM